MKLGIRLLLVVALLLPVRGALAVAGALCHGLPAGASHAAENARSSWAAQQAPHGHFVAAHLHPDHGTGEHVHADGDARNAPGSPTTGASETAPWSADDGTCSLCSAVCSAAPLPAAGIHLRSEDLPGGPCFERATSACPAVSPGALERPPRTA